MIFASDKIISLILEDVPNEAYFKVILNETLEEIGHISYTYENDSIVGNLSYFIYEEHRNKGYGKKALKLLVDNIRRIDDNDLYLTLPLTITEGALGCKKEVPTLDGKTVISIPSGSQTGDRIRIKSKGLKSPKGRQVGDMFVILKVITPTKLDRNQKKLLEELNETNLKNSEFDLYEKYLKSNS